MTAHACAPPTTGPILYAAVGRLGDMWCCDQCGRRWIAATGCDLCHQYGNHPHPGQHAAFERWRPAKPATIWQKIAQALKGNRR